MSFSALNPDVRRMIFKLCDDPVNTARICKQSYNDTQTLIYNISKGVLHKINAWELDSLSEKYRSILPEHVKEKIYQEALIFRRVVLRQDDEFKWLFQYYMNITTNKHPKIPSVTHFIRIEKMISMMNNLSFYQSTFESIFNGRAQNTINADLIIKLLACLTTNTLCIKNNTQSSFEKLYNELSELNTLSFENFQLLDNQTTLKELHLHWQAFQQLSTFFRMTRVSNKIGVFENMKSFTLCNNQIRSLPKEFKNLTKLIVLNLETTELNSISEDIQGMETLKKINVRVHPLCQKQREGYDRIWKDYKPAITHIKKLLDDSIHLVTIFILLFLLYKICEKSN